MDFAFSEEQEQIREAIQKICARFDDAYWLKKDKEGGFPRRVAPGAREGWMARRRHARGIRRFGPGITEAAVMMQAIAESGAGFSGASAVHMNIFGLNPVVVFGNKSQKQRMLPPLIAGKERACFAVTEPNTGLNTRSLKTKAVKKGKKYLVSARRSGSPLRRLPRKSCC
jgi:acyl-CoA dehydrogenase